MALAATRAAQLTTTGLESLGWTDAEAAQVAAHAHVARVFAVHRSDIEVRGPQGLDRIDRATAGGLDGVAVGDWLELTDAGGVARILERRNAITRKAAGEHVHRQVLSANVDRLLIVTSCNQEFSLRRLERYLVLACDCDVTPEIVLTKADLTDQVAGYADQATSLLAGVRVHAVDARSAEQVGALVASLRLGETLALIGSSGVGKSTLGNAIGAPNLETGAIRKLDDKGRHTTTVRAMFPLPSGALLIDNPGIRELQLTDCERGIARVFADVLSLAERCQFQDCQHDAEPGCAVREAIADGRLPARRLESLQDLRTEQARNAEILESKRQRARDIGHKYRKLNWSKRAKRGQ